MTEPDPTEPDAAPPHARGLRLSDLLGITAGYGLAAWLAQAFRPRSIPGSALAYASLAFEFAWLGLMMSGPLVLFLERERFAPGGSGQGRGKLIGDVPPGTPPEPDPIGARRAYSRAELAWSVIGAYWIGLAVLVVPLRSGETPWLMMSLVPVLGLAWLLVAPRPRAGSHPPRGWTHPTAVALLWTTPLAWLNLVLIARALM